MESKNKYLHKECRLNMKKLSSINWEMDPIYNKVKPEHYRLQGLLILVHFMLDLSSKEDDEKLI